MYPTITTAALPDGMVGAGYSRTISATGTVPIRFVVTGGSLPAGLGLQSETGVLSGVPTFAGASAFTITAANRLGAHSMSYTMAVLGTATGPVLRRIAAPRLRVVVPIIALVVIVCGSLLAALNSGD